MDDFFVISISSKYIEPVRGLIRPEIVLSRVDFPAPFAPINVTISPFLTSSETENSA